MLEDSAVDKTQTAAQEYLSPKELAAKLHVSLKSITNWTQARRIPGQIKIGGIWRYSVLEIEKALFAGQFLLGGRL
jgi:hypothetical protein